MIQKKTELIGSREFISLYEERYVNVPAKVDTGADSSAIWASNIVEENGALTFELFGRGSRFFTGEKLTAESYSITQVKNSFGISEMRFKVKIPTTINNRKLKVQYTLADRSRNKYPVLIGKKTLAGKFHVDVTLAPGRTAHNQRVMMLNVKDSSSIQKFANKLTTETPGLQCDFSSYDNLIITLDGENGVDVMRSDTNESLNLYDLIYFKTHAARHEFALAISEYLGQCGIDFIDRELASGCSNTKVSQYAKLARYGLPVPRTIMVCVSIMGDQYDRFVNSLGTPFILKDPGSDKGEANYLVKTREQFNEIVTHIPETQAYFVAQQFIANDGDYRVVVLNKSVEMVIRRRREDESTHLNNTSTGGKASLIDVSDFPSAASVIAVEAAIALDRQVAGVDLMQDATTGEWYILEVNNSPQLASGAFQSEKTKAFGKFLRMYAEK